MRRVVNGDGEGDESGEVIEYPSTNNYIDM